MTLGQVLKLMRQQWTQLTNRQAVVGGYRALGTQHAHTLADIGLRNYLFSPLPQGDALALARAAGRQDCAREIFDLARLDPALAHRLLESKPTENRT